MNRSLAISFASAAVAEAGAVQEPAYKRDLPDSLKREAKVCEADAIAVAKRLLPRT